MTNNRRKGRLGETEAARVLRGERISRTGESGSDVRDKRGNSWEVKRIKSWPSRIDNWFKQAHAQGDFGVIARANRGRWYAIVPIENFLEVYYDDNDE